MWVEFPLRDSLDERRRRRDSYPEALEIVQLGLDLRPGDEVVSTNEYCWAMWNTCQHRVRREGIVYSEIKFSAPYEFTRTKWQVWKMSGRGARFDGAPTLRTTGGYSLIDAIRDQERSAKARMKIIRRAPLSRREPTRRRQTPM